MNGEVIIRNSVMDMNDEENLIKIHSPLCKEGIMTPTDTNEECDEGILSIFGAALNVTDSFDLGDSDFKANCFERSDSNEFVLLLDFSELVGAEYENSDKLSTNETISTHNNYHQIAQQSDDGAKPYTCERCGKSFIRKSMLINHMTSSHKHTALETPCFTCKICFEAFLYLEAVVSHVESQHKLDCMDDSTNSFEKCTINRLYICEFCERCYAESTILNTHREQHPAEAPYECKFCNKQFSCDDDIKIHRSSHVGDDIPIEYFLDFTIPKTYFCKYCEGCFINQVKYSEHLTVHYGPEPYQCQHCSLKFSTSSEAVEHRANHGDDPSPSESYNFDRLYGCHYCYRKFCKKDTLIRHIRIHTGEKPFICDVCGKGFSQSSSLYTHKKIHSSERPYSCSICPRTFKIKWDRDEHVRTHTGDRPYKCEYCHKTFMTMRVYSQHRRIHSSERPYKCEVCDKGFIRSSVLNMHKLTHTGEKPYICDICGKSYKQKGYMMKHRRVQHHIMGDAKH